RPEEVPHDPVRGRQRLPRGVEGDGADDPRRQADGEGRRRDRRRRLRLDFPDRGAIAQLGERLDRTQEVAGSSPASSTSRTPAQAGVLARPFRGLLSLSCGDQDDSLPRREAVAYHPSMLPEGVHHWTATHPEWEGPVSAYAIDDGARLILIDPIAVPDEVRALFGSREVVTVLTSTWHERDAASLGFPVWAPAPDRPEDQLVPATRYAVGDSLFGMEAYPGREGQLDLVLWTERIRAVVAGDTLIDLGNGREIPASWLPEGITVEQVAAGLRPLLDKPVEVVLPTHGEPADRAALEHALA